MGLPFELHYEAPAQCPAETELRAQIESRLAPSEVAASVDARRFVVVIRPASVGFAARLELAGPAGASVRDVSEPTCERLVRSLSVIIAIAADPTGDPERPPPPPRDPEPARTQSRVVRLPRAVPAEPSRWQWGGGASVGLAYAGGAFSGARVQGEVRRLGPVLTWTLRASWGYVDRSERLAPRAEAQLRLRTGRLEACASLPLGGIEPALCPAFELGTLQARTDGLAHDGSARLRWSAPGLVARIGVPLGQHVRVELQVASFAPLQRPEFWLAQPDRLVYRPPLLTLDGQLGLVVIAPFP